MSTKKLNKSVPISREILEAADKIIQKAFACKTNEDFRDTIALDNVFKYAYGKSALEMAGIFLTHDFHIKMKEIPTGDKCLERHTYVNYQYTWHHNLLPSLPQNEHHFWYVGSEAEDGSDIISEYTTSESE